MFHWKRSQEGWLMIDHRDSPGLKPGEGVIPGKPLPVTVGKGELYESATVSCAHCQTVVIINPLRTRERNYCAKCDRYVCDNAQCILHCTPFAKLADIVQNAAEKGVIIL